MKRNLLLIVIGITAVLQVLWGVWILIDLKSAAGIFFGKNIDPLLLIHSDFKTLSNVAGTSFLMLGVYSVSIFIMVFQKRITGTILALLAGTMITLISVSTFVSSGSFIVLLTDTLRGFLTVLFAVIYLLKLKGQEK